MPVPAPAAAAAAAAASPNGPFQPPMLATPLPASGDGAPLVWRLHSSATCTAVAALCSISSGVSVRRARLLAGVLPADAAAAAACGWHNERAQHKPVRIGIRSQGKDECVGTGT